MRDTISRFDYHSAQKPAVRSDPVTRWESDGSVAFVYDIMDKPTLPADYADCDVFYTDPPWQTGFGLFNRRAGIQDGRSFSMFVSGLTDIVTATDRPLILVTGKHALKSLPPADAEVPVQLNETPALAIVYNWTGPIPNWGSAIGVIRDLAQRFERVGDFCCGYGRTARLFLAAGKRFTVSDNNPQCIGYIAQHIDDWQVG